MKKIQFTDEQINTIKNLYLNENQTLKNIGAMFGVSKGVISRIIKENLPSDLIRKTTHKYKADYNIFETIDTPEKAYWLGFIAADGCVFVRDKNASIIINIHEKDVEHLEKFKKFVKSDAKIVHHIQTEGFSNNTPMVKFTLNSVKMAQDLINKGVVPKKSLILKPPNIEEEFYLPYILGYFDGDGSIHQFNNNREFGISIQGTKEILEWILSVLNQPNTSLEKRYADGKNSFYIRWGGIQKVYNILKPLYESVNCNLSRKYEIFKILETVVLSRNTE